VATFTDAGFTGNPASAYTASINWGDGTVTAGTVSGSAGSYTVTGTHAYADEGTQTATVTFTETGVSNGTAMASADVAVAEGDVLTPSPVTITPTEGTAFSGPVASFTDTNTGNVASDFTATIAWGDGTSTTGVTPTGGSGTFTVSGSHTYAEEGSFPVTVVLTDVDDDHSGQATARATATSTATVAEAFGLTGGGAALPALPERTPLVNVVVATFTHGPNTDPPSTFAATITWGDGTTSNGAVVLVSGGYQVLGSHTYADESFLAGQLWPVTVVITHTSGQRLTLTTAAPVLEQALPPGSPHGPHGTQNERWLSELFADVFGRPITAGEVKKLGRRLARGTSRRQLALELLTPGVVRAFNRRLGITAATSAADKANRYFLALLDHAITEPALPIYLDMLRRFGDQYTLMAILRSDEYFRLVAL
jgi:hypothetical protein